MSKPRIITNGSLEKIVQDLKRDGKRIVLTQGSFDMVHIGHARYCEKARSYGDVLIVGVDSDEKIRIRKGDDRPVVPEKERTEILTHLRSVDYVVLKQLDWPRWHLIKIIQPDVLVATKDTYNAEQIKELKQYCQKIVVLDPMATTSTSAKIRLVQLGAAKRMSNSLNKRLVKAVEDVLEELKGSD